MHRVRRALERVRTLQVEVGLRRADLVRVRVRVSVRFRVRVRRVRVRVRGSALEIMSSASTGLSVPEHLG